MRLRSEELIPIQFLLVWNDLYAPFDSHFGLSELW